MNKNIFRVTAIALVGVVGYGACASASTPPEDSTPVATSEPALDVPSSTVAPSTAPTTTQPSMDLVLEDLNGQPVTVTSYCDIVDLAMEFYGESMRCNREDPMLVYAEAMYKQIMTNDPGALHRYSESFHFADYFFGDLPVVPAEDMSLGIFACGYRSVGLYKEYLDSRGGELSAEGLLLGWRLAGEILCPWLVGTYRDFLLPTTTDPEFIVYMTTSWGEDIMVTCGELNSAPCSPELLVYFNSFPEVNPYGFQYFPSDQEAGNLYVEQDMILFDHPVLMSGLGLQACFAEQVSGTGFAGFQEYLTSRSISFASEDEALVFFGAALGTLCTNW